MTKIYCKCGTQTLEDTVCAECGEPLRAEIPVEDGAMPIFGNWVREDMIAAMADAIKAVFDKLEQNDPTN